MEYQIYPNRVEAINGWQLTQEQKQELMGDYPLRMRGGQIGCLLSHISVIRDAYLRNYEYIWVCEDDIAIHENPHNLSEIISQLSSIFPYWDVLYTDIDSKDAKGNRVPSLCSDFRPDCYHETLEYYNIKIPINKDITQIKQRFGAYSMVISRNGIKKIYEYFTKFYLWTAYDIDIHYIPNIIEFSLNRDLVSVDYTLPSDTSSMQL